MFIINQFSEAQKVAVWNKAAIAPGKLGTEFRLDPCGALIEWTKYGDNTPEGTGWEIDHIFPESKGGTNDLYNLQALQWEHNRKKADGPNSSYCFLKWQR